MRFLPFITFAFALFVSNAIASDNSRFLRTGLEVLYQQEVNRYRSCQSAGNSFCRFSELNFFLGLLDLATPLHVEDPKYPAVAERFRWQAVVEAVLVISDEGTVSEVETLYCESGRTRDIKLRWRWELEGRFCREFRYAAEKAFSDYTFLASPDSLKDAERLANVGLAFQMVDLTGRTDHDVNQQLLDLNKGQVRTLQKFLDAEDWNGLREYALKRRDESEVFEYYLGNAAWESGNKPTAIGHFSDFLKEGGDRYWHFGTKAMVIAIDHFYEVGDDQQVIDLGNAFLLEEYLNTGNSIAKPVVAEALTKYAISLTLIEDQELAQALYLLRALERVGLYRGIPKALKEVIQTQRNHLESQIINIGKAKARQLSDPVQLD
tara:strand:+ start:130 stop:1263 length:1134 start_codon:yes stop_codon:yes gene_type:complete